MSLNLQDMMARVQELQSRMNETQEKLRALESTVEVGGGMVRVTINGKQEIRKISLEKNVVSPDDIELLEDLILSAVNKAIEQSQKMAKEEMSKATSGMIPNIPGLDLGNLGL
ncbi:MAG: YbaB/EbfC family nucleoid-associated protein [Bacteroidetes bacterium]|nr:YbaB/EbfC family nucleoid-associated protein [Bacteroidota bacterium]